MSEESKQTNDSKYIQQHLANERTYLAWIRTSITIIGVGFLITNLHFSTMTTKVEISDLLAKIIGIASILSGILTIILTTIRYFAKGRDINSQTFRFSKKMVIYLSVSLIIIFFVFAVYFLFAWELIKT
jgi:putative membrane protein